MDDKDTSGPEAHGLLIIVAHESVTTGRLTLIFLKWVLKFPPSLIAVMELWSDPCDLSLMCIYAWNRQQFRVHFSSLGSYCIRHDILIHLAT